MLINIEGMWVSLLSITPGKEKVQTNKERIPGLDGLRAIAIIGVLFYHMFPFTIKGGFLGVTLFFVLSGYLCAITYANSWKNSNFDILLYYKKRIKRIYPPLFIVVFITIGVLKIVAPETIVGIRSEVFSILFGYNNWWQISQNASYFTRITNTSPFTHLWSLSIELQYYFIFPFLFLLYKGIKKSKFKYLAVYNFLFLAILFAIPMAVLYRPYEDISRVYYGTDTRIFSLLLGTFLGFMQMHKRKNVISGLQAKRKILYFIMLIVITFFSFVFLEGQGAITYRGGMFAISIVFCFIIGLTVHPQLHTGKWLDAPPLLWIGKRSYEIYLWQYPVIFLFNYFNWSDIPFSPLIQLIIILIISSWLHYILSFKKFIIGGKNMKQIKKLSIMVITMVSLFTFCLGGCSIIIPQDSNYGSQNNLQKELERNSEELDKEQTVKSNKMKLKEAEKEKGAKSDKKKSEESEKEKAAKSDKRKSEDSKKEQASNSDEQLDNSADSLNFITAIGDSVMLGAAPSLKKAMPDSIIDAKESRQVVKAKEIIDNLSSEEKLGRTVIIALGTNGPFSESKGQELIDQLGKDRTIYWITVYGKQLQWQDKSNSTIRKLAEDNENVSIIDWEKAVSTHSEWLYNDGIHLNSKGQAAYTDFIVKSISPQ